MPISHSLHDTGMPEIARPDRRRLLTLLAASVIVPVTVLRTHDAKSRTAI